MEASARRFEPPTQVRVESATFHINQRKVTF